MRFKFPTCILFFLFINGMCAQVFEKNLNKQNWKFRKKGDTKWYKASVPGTVHTDLLENKIIPDPFFGDNEKKLQWIENENWEYSTTFRLSDKELKQDNIELQFEGLDTYAKVFLNDSLILSADNMFRIWTVEIKKYLHKEKNKLYILFESPVGKGKEESAKLSYTLPGDEKVFTRKAQYQFGWDWGPRFVTSGIWKDVKISSWNDARILNTQCIQKKLTDSIAELEFICEIKSDVNASAYLDISYAFTKDLSGQRTNKIKLTKGVNTYSVFYDIRKPQKWWTNGLGFPSMYYFDINLSYDSRILTHEKISVGLRTLELVQESDSVGASFYFKLNGIPVFMKGANYIPPDNFLPRVSGSDYNAIIKNAVDANMNMLRVWGGGIYADDQFYNECDRNGILVWQDFMFACAMYPADEHFKNNVAEEVKGQVKRLRNHPCIALWCGNNEIEEGWKNWGWQKQFNYSIQDSTIIANDYHMIFNGLIKDIVKHNDPQRSYWPSSPSIGWGHAASLLKGDSHYWGVWWGMEPFDTFNKKVGRFMSEYGFQGMPEINTFKKIGLKFYDISIDSTILKAHQKHPKGYETIGAYMERDYKVPKDLYNYIYISQLLQANGMKTAIEAHRRAMPFCMGTLYWQLNDCWPVTSWSSVDYFNNWKASNYFVKKAFENILISVDKVNNKHRIYVINDGLESKNCRLYVRLIDFKGNVLWSKSTDVKITANSSSIYDVIDIKDFGYFDQRQAALYISLVIDKTEITNTLYFFVKPKELNLIKPAIEIGKRKCSECQCFSISSDVLMKDVFLTIDNKPVRFSDNFFDLLPNQEKIIYLPKNVKIRNLEKKIKVASLLDTY